MLDRLGILVSLHLSRLPVNAHMGTTKQAFVQLHMCYMWTLPFICGWMNHQSFVNMDRSRQIQRWILAIVILMTSLAGMGVALTPDGLALMEFKDGLNVTSPLLQNWSRSGASPCSWGGISCTESGEVRSIILSAQDPMLEGNISSSLGKLKSLEVLMLDQNSLSGSIPPELGNLSSLVTLFLYLNRMSGEIPPQLGNCSSLIELWLNGNILGGNIPESLGNLKHLGNVSLSENLLTGEIPVQFAALPKLFQFNVGSNRLTGSVPPVIYKNLNLIYYLVRGNNLSGDITTALEELSNLPAIKMIAMENNSFSGSLPPSIENANTLTDLKLSNNKLNGTIPSSLGNLVNVTYLWLFNNRFSGPIPDSLTSLINLRSVALGYNSLTGPIPTNMSKFTALEKLFLHNNSMSGPIPEDFGRFMSNLTIFDIAYNSFNGTLPDGLCQGGKLQWLLVNSNRFHGDIPSSLASCATLIRVRLSDNQFTTIPRGFGSNSSLEFLDVSRNQLTGQLPTSLGSNSQLAYLDLSQNRLIGNISILEFSQLAQNLSVLNLARNKFSGEIPAAMAMCKLLYRVDLSYNSLTGSVPPALANLSSLQMLHLQGNNLTALHSSIYSGLATELRGLNLAENPWNAPIAAEIGSLKILQTLNLSHGGQTGSIPSVLGQLTQLEVLDLSHNNLTGEVPSSLGDLMTSLTSVNISFNRLTGSLPPAWVKFLVADPGSFCGNPGLCLQYNANNVCVSRTSAGSGGKIKLSVRVLVGVGLGMALALAIFAALLFWWRGPGKSGMKPAPVDIIVQNLTKDTLPFTFEEIMAATENLSDSYIIGRGSHGVVYKVALASRVPIVVKKIVSLDMTTAVVHKSFWSEIDTIGHAKHRNLVRLLGFIKWGEVGLLLYDYISNGDLHSALHNREGGCDVDLTWKARLRIAEGVAQGLAYLHHDYNPPIIHRDIKSSNVLLDNDLEAHISDFGLAKLLGVQRGSQEWLSTSNVSGTYGYIAPEVGYGTLVSPHLDVYSYGVVLLELLTRKQPSDPSYGESLHVATWVKANVLQNEQMSDSMLDPSLLVDLTNSAAKEEMFFVQRIALLCTRENPADRPTMRDVTNMLKSLSKTIEKKYEMETLKENEQKTMNNMHEVENEEF